MISYYRDVWVTAWSESKARIRGGMREVIQFAIQTGVFLTILFFLPVLGQFKDEARLTLAAIGGLITSAVLMFLIELVKAPALMAERSRAEVIRLGQVLKFNQDDKAIRQEGYDIYERWRAAMPPETYDANYAPIEPIEAEAREFIKMNFHDRELMSYKYGTGYHAEDPPVGGPAYYRRRLDAFHSILLSCSTEAEEMSYQFRPKDWKSLWP